MSPQISTSNSSGLKDQDQTSKIFDVKKEESDSDPQGPGFKRSRPVAGSNTGHEPHGSNMENSNKRLAPSTPLSKGHHKLPRAFDSGSRSAESSAAYRARPVRSCTHCRQQKIKCNALETYPEPCSRCAKMDRKCVVDPLFRPQKGGQVQLLRDDISSLKQQLAALQRISTGSPESEMTGSPQHSALEAEDAESLDGSAHSPEFSLVKSGPAHKIYPADMDSNSRVLFGDSLPNHSETSLHRSKDASEPPKSSLLYSMSPSLGNGSAPISKILSHPPGSPPVIDTNRPGDMIPEDNIHASRQPSSIGSSNEKTGYIMGDVVLSYEYAEELHARFMSDYLPFLPIIQSNSAAELYRQSQLLFWTVCLTASLSEPVPTFYNSLCSLIKQLAIETCWIQTPRSTHIVQALLILGNWPLPNEKVLDDCSYRFITLAKALAKQLGLHRGKFIYEFSRTQVSLPDAEKWRTRTWISIFIAEQVWCANLGLPPNMPMDYLLEESRTDTSLPASFRSLACLAMFCSKLVNLLGSSVTSPDGTLEPKYRFSTLGILEQELDRLITEMGKEDVTVEIYYLYLKMMICVFSFLPETPLQDQAIYIVKAYHAATRVVTLFSGLAERRRIITFPIYIRQPVSFAAFILFRLHLSPLLLPQYVESCRQSVVTVHRLYRNMLTAWKDVENDISRTAKVLEKLNFVIITHPELFTKASGIITRMRSHLTASLFYELIWAIHEARRRGGVGSSSNNAAAFVAAATAATANPKPNTYGAYSNAPTNTPGAHLDSVRPLPFYNQITQDDFTTTTTTTPNGTTVTTLVPTHNRSGQRSDKHTNANTTPQEQHPNMSVDVASKLQRALSGMSANNAAIGNTGAANKGPEDPVDPTAAPTGDANTPGPFNGTPGGGDFGNSMAQFYDATGISTDPLHLDTLIQGIDWMDAKGDDLLGWMDNLDMDMNI